MTIPVPERGQPIDTSYIYQIVETVNKLSEKITPATNTFLTVREESAKITESRIIAKVVTVVSGREVKAGETKGFSLGFQNDFKFPPVVTATILNQEETVAGKNAFAVLTSVTRDGVAGFVRFNENGTANVLVHIIAIGLPN